MERANLLRWSSWAAFAATGALFVILVVGAPIAEESMRLWDPGDPATFAVFLSENAARIQWMIALDTLFPILYTCVFVAVARLTADRSRLVAGVGLGAILLTFVLDLVENAHTLTMTDAAVRGAVITAGSTEFLNAVAQVKFNSSYLAMALFTFGVWGRGRLGTGLAIFFMVLVIVGALTYAYPPVGPIRVLLFIVGLVLGGLLLQREASERKGT